MNNFFVFHFKENIIEKVSSFIYEEFYKKGKDLSKICIVFGGKRPALFLRKSLAQKIKRSFFSPVVFSTDLFMEFIIKNDVPFLKKISNLDALFVIFNLIKEVCPKLLKDKNFVSFSCWAKEIISFLEELDLNAVEENSLKVIEEAAKIGYEVPSSINELLQNISLLRKKYHQYLKKNHLYYRGLMYLSASKKIEREGLPFFEKVILVNPFYLYKTEEKIIKKLFFENKMVIFFQTDEKRWESLKNIENLLKIRISPQKVNFSFNINLFAGFNTHSQVSFVRQILKNLPSCHNTVILLPRPENLIPLLTEISSYVKEFNVSCGYPLKRSIIYSLIKSIYTAQIEKSEQFYYAKDYLSVLTNPLVKNIRFENESAVTRVLIHKIEEHLLGMQESTINKKIFIKLEEIENEENIYFLAQDTLESIGIKIKRGNLKEIVKKLHCLFFSSLEEIENLEDFSTKLEEVLKFSFSKSLLKNYPFNLNILDKVLSILEDFKTCLLKREKIIKEDIWDLFIDALEEEVISFSGSPLKGLQILGIFEVRSLNFENVIILDLNEGVYPKLRVYEPLIPQEVFLSLGIDRIEREEEILRYNFYRLLYAKNAYLIYEEREDKERSRFIEEIVWEEERKRNRLNVL
ncbi:MAG TPA: hypothetical protein EYP89_03105, partial [Candidatus Omnitrophica bacterium]|nr:hypothetical protein [Candidatus Omnitrophota bacterium]